MKKSERGLTLLELILALTIVAIGAAVALPQIHGIEKKRMLRDAGEILETLGDAGRKYTFETGATPAVMSTLSWSDFRDRLIERGLINEALLQTSKYCFDKGADSNGTGIWIYAYLKRNQVCSDSLEDYVGFYANLSSSGRANDMKYVQGKAWTTRGGDENNF